MDAFPSESVTHTCNGGPFGLAKGEFFVICPYNNNHKPLQNRFMNHLLNCRKNYLKSTHFKGFPPFQLTCKFNFMHQVPAPEIRLHEHACLDKDNQVFQALAANSTVMNILDNISKEENEAAAAGQKKEVFPAGKPNFEMYPLIGDKIFVQGHGLLTFREIYRNCNTSAPTRVLEEKVFFADPAIAKANRKFVLKTDEKLPFISMRRRKQRQHLVSTRPLDFTHEKHAQELADEEEDWEKSLNANTKPRYWIDNWKYLKSPTWSYPPGLSKKERKLFCIHNTERFATERGLFDPRHIGPDGKLNIRDEEFERMMMRMKIKRGGLNGKK